MERRNRLIRIFVSSTFQDMELERNALQQHVVPQMQQWCQERGWQFETVDLRWGINEEASQAHRTMSICLEELANCQRLSPKPHLLLLLGQRYGWLPLPESLTQNEVAALTATAEDGERALFHKVYRLEDNLYPASYELQGTCSLDEEHCLRGMMMRYCEQQDDSVFYNRHLVSATEQEIQQGLLSHIELFNQVVTYERTLTGLPQQLEALYLDPDHRRELSLLHKKVNEAVPQHNIIARTVDYAVYDSDDYALWFAGQVRERLQALVEEEIAANPIDEYEEERRNQQYTMTSAAAVYQPRGEEIAAIMEAMLALDQGRLCVVYGPSGAGLTSLAAHICQRLAIGGNRLIYRFAGIGQMSSSGLLLLRSLLKEAEVDFDDNDSVFDLMAKWCVFLEESNQRQILVIDGLDRLEIDDWMRHLQWLPSPLPTGLHVLLTLSDSGAVMGLERFAPVEVTLPPLDDKLFVEAFLNDLRLHNRQLRAIQVEEVRRVYDSIQSPLARHPLVAIASQWAAADSPRLDTPSLQALMDIFLDGLIMYNYHDESFLGLTLGLLCFCRHGVSEHELLEITASDTAFYSRLMQQAHHRIVESGRSKVPFIYWSRLHHDAGFFLVLRQNKNSITYVFANKTIEHCVERWLEKRYPAIRHKVVSLACDYFGQVGGKRAYEELPYLLECLGDERRQQEYIAGEDLMLGKCGADMTDDLIADYDHYLKRHADSDAATIVRQRRLFLLKNRQMIATYAKYGTDIILSLWEQDPDNIAQAATPQHSSGKARSIIHIPGQIILAAANDDLLAVCHGPTSGISDSYIQCLLTDRMTRVDKAFALLPLGWNTDKPSKAMLSDDGKTLLLFSFSGEYYILWHTDTSVIDRRKKDELWDMAMMPDGGIYYLSRSEMRRLDDSVVCSFGEVLGIDSNQKRLICPDPAHRTVYIVLEGRQRYVRHHLDNGTTEVVCLQNTSFAYIIGYDSHSASLLYREEEDKSIFRHRLRDNKTEQMPVAPSVYIAAATIVSDKWLVYIEDGHLVCTDITTGITTVSDCACSANLPISFGTQRHLLTTGCYELKEWVVDD